jgi:hypothetical protein
MHSSDIGPSRPSSSTASTSPSACRARRGEKGHDGEQGRREALGAEANERLEYAEAEATDARGPPRPFSPWVSRSWPVAPTPVVDFRVARATPSRLPECGAEACAFVIHNDDAAPSAATRIHQRGPLETDDDYQGMREASRRLRLTVLFHWQPLELPHNLPGSPDHLFLEAPGLLVEIDHTRCLGGGTDAEPA